MRVRKVAVVVAAAVPAVRAAARVVAARAVPAAVRLAAAAAVLRSNRFG